MAQSWLAVHHVMPPTETRFMSRDYCIRTAMFYRVDHVQTSERDMKHGARLRE
jgi:hypothetical protein